MFLPLDIKLIVAYKSPFSPAITYLVEAVKGYKPLFETLVITEGWGGEVGTRDHCVL